MAAAGSQAFIPDDLVHCSLCLELFTQPKGLPCFHTFCLQCLQQYVDTNNFTSHLLCPLCQADTVIPGNNVSLFQNNFLVSNLVQSLQQTTQEPEVKETPDEDTHHACQCCDNIRHGNDFCATCQMWMCEVCSRGHKRVPATREHDVKSNLDMDRISKAQCEDKRCLVSDFKQKIDVKISSLRDENKNVAKRREELTGQIKAAAEKLRKSVDRQEKLLLDQVHLFHDESKHKIENLLVNIDEHTRIIDNLEKSIQNILQTVDGQLNHQRVNDLEEFFSAKSDQLRDILSDKSKKWQRFEMFEGNLETMKIGQLNEGKSFNY